MLNTYSPLRYETELIHTHDSTVSQSFSQRGGSETKPLPSSPRPTTRISGTSTTTYGDGHLIVSTIRPVKEQPTPSSFLMLSSTTSADEIVVDGDGDNNIAPSSSSTRIMPRDPPTSAEEEEEEEDGHTATTNNNTNTHVNDATTATPTRQRDSNFSRLTDPTTNVSQQRHNYNQRRSPQLQSQQPQSLQQTGVSMRNGSSKRGEHEQSQKIIKSSRPSSAKGVALGGGSLERFIGQQVGGGNGGSDGHRGSRLGKDDGTYGADSDLTMPTALQQMIPRRNNKSFNNDYVDGDEDEEEDD